MAQTLITVENLSKRFQINAAVNTDTLRGHLSSMARSVLGRGRAGGTVEGEDYIWALKDLSFEVKQGEVLGIVGKNGSGKSTLLKILSRILPPTKGRITLKGRVASLLEVGTGFHPELSGRENVYLNAAILGMSRQEIRRKFDEIVAFAEVERFIDTPIKHYSSGMYMRLAFSVAAHLEQEILIVDEVLAVGDASFQKKSLGKMGQVATQGRTVLFVTHSMAALASLCPRSILLANGHMLMDAPTKAIIKEYIGQTALEQGERQWDDPRSAPGTESIRLKAVRVICDGEITVDVDIQKEIHIEFEFWNFKPDQYINTGILLLNDLGVEVFTSANWPSANLVNDAWSDQPHPVGVFRTGCAIPANFLNDGRYSIDVTITTDVNKCHVYERNVIAFNVYETGGMSKEYTGKWFGVVRPKLAWQTAHIAPLEEVEQSR